MNDLTTSKQHYIKAVYELSGNGEGVRISDIAAKVGVTKASASIGIQALQKKGLIKRNAERLVFLTAAGEREAVTVYDKYTIIKDFLVNVLGVEHETAAADACAIEHVISLDTLCALCRFTGKKEGDRQEPGGCHKQVCTTPNSEAYV